MPSPNLKKYIITIFLIFILPFMLPSCAAAEDANRSSANETSVDPLDLMKQMGQAERKIMDQKTSGGELYAKGKTIRINRQEVEMIKLRYDLEGASDGEQKAYQYLVRREALLQLALKNGYTVSLSEAQEYVDRQKEAMEGHSDPAFSAYLDGIGMSVSEYWDSQYEVLKNELLTGKYLNAVKSQYIKEHHCIGWEEEEQTGWRNYLDDMAREYIDGDDVKKVE